MSRDEMDAMVRLIKENTKTKNSSEYKLKRDFAVITFGENHYSVVRRKDVTDKDVVVVSELPRYCCYGGNRLKIQFFFSCSHSLYL